MIPEQLFTAVGRGAAMMADDVAVVGGRLIQNRDPKKPRKPRIALIPVHTGAVTSRIGMPRGQTVFKQEKSDMTEAATIEANRSAMENELAAMLDAEPNPERRAIMLHKVGVFQQELRKMAPMLANVDDELRELVLTEWFDGGEALLKRLVWNAEAGEEEIPLAKRAEPSAGEAALAKMLEEAPSDEARAHLLHKITVHTSDLRNGIAAIADQSDEKKAALAKTWIEAGDSELKKNILDAEMNRDGKRLYGTGVQADQVVEQTAGNASSHVGSQMRGSETNSDQRIGRTIPRMPTGAGAGARVGNVVMPGGKGGESPNPGSGPNDGGGGEVRPATLIRRTGTTGGLGNSQGADTAGKKVTEVDPKKKKKKLVEKVEGPWDDARKAELGGALFKIAPDGMIEIMGELKEDEQVAVVELAGWHAADLVVWNHGNGETLAKRDLDASIATWLGADPNTTQLKQWVAEALMTSEDIPLELGKAIMAWKPPLARAA